MRSKIDPYTINEDESRAIISKFCRNNSWKYRKMEWDNDIDGEIEIFDKKGETSAKFIKVQLKTIDDSRKFENLITNYTFDADVKFLHFCDVCDIPIILCVFDIHKEKGYFIFMQKYIYEVLDLENSKWRNNSSKVRIKIPLINSLNTLNSRNKLENIAYEGTNLISQLRKTLTHKKYYSLLKQDDNSNGVALRTNLRILVERSFASSKEAMRILIPKINEEYKSKIYLRNKISDFLSKKKEYDVIYIHFFDSLGGESQGVPLCSTIWVRENLPEIARPLIGKSDEVLSGINTSWRSTIFEDDFIEKNTLDKGEYIPIADKLLDNFTILYEKILYHTNRFCNDSITPKQYIRYLNKLVKKLDKLHQSTINIGFPPSECKDLDNKINNLVASLHDISIIVSDKDRDFFNMLNCINMSLNNIERELPEYKYERKKVK
ncbi:MAG: DUF4365 domain-containing protein [Kordia sp.]|uniref:DUF4365 domain-containing protein n=1 Tax=Kordia sp. TaxID=1965332 RepID=UPI00385F2378